MIQFFIGTEEKTRIADQVLEHSIRSRTALDVSFTRMIGPEWEYPTSGIKVGTGFSLRRWLIPASVGWTGYAVYLDADQIVLGDVRELISLGVSALHRSGISAVATTYQPDKLSRTPRPNTSVMFIDCARAKVQWGFDRARMLEWFQKNPSKESYGDFMAAGWMEPQPAELPVEWNHLNIFKEGETKLLHYTKEPEQPFYKPDHPLAYLWRKELVSAIRAGVVDKRDFEFALGQWGKRKDWRATNGLHPLYKKYLTLFADAPCPQSS